MDIEKAIVILKDEDCFWNSPEKDILEAIKHVLAEREADKKKIKELEEALLKVKDKNIKLFIHYKNSIPKQKVKDKIKDLEYNSDYLGFEKSLEEIFKIEVLEELLQEEDK